MNAADVTAWIRTHPAVAAAGGGAVLLAVLYLRHRHRTQTASQTAGTTGATTDGGGQYLVPYDGTGDYTQGDPATTNALTNILTLLAGLNANEAAQTAALGTIAKNTRPHKPAPKKKKAPHRGGHGHGAHTGKTSRPKFPTNPGPLPPRHLRAGGPVAAARPTTATRTTARRGARLPVVTPR